MIPRVSIIVAVYNIEKLVSRCINSLICQTLKETEIILVDDCSTDDSGRICEAFAEKNEKMVVIHHKANLGLSAARNTGIENARGEYLAFVDGDDYIEPDTYRQVYGKAAENTADIVVFGYFNDRKNGAVEEHRISGHSGIYTGKDVMRALFPEVIGTLPNAKTDYSVGYMPWGLLVRRQMLLDKGVRFTSERQLIYEDLMFALDVYPQVQTAIVLEEAYYHYCENPDSLTMSVKPERYDRVKEMYEYLKADVEYGKMLFSDRDVELRLKRTMLSYVRLCIIQLAKDRKYYGKAKQIIGDEICHEILRGYPVHRLPVKQAVFAFLVKIRWKRAAYELVRRYVRKNKLQG